AISGSFRLRLTDGKEQREFLLDDCTKGIYVPRLTFTDLVDFTPDAVCLVLANTHYDMGKSLRSYEAYIRYLKEHGLL
ncbi:MAG: WxcM-like domain-containing protein, partial [Bacteroidales bacterium]|nr:WxcM-like domain-containing protein [Bacteroidales bacterium]